MPELNEHFSQVIAKLVEERDGYKAEVSYLKDMNMTLEAENSNLRALNSMLENANKLMVAGEKMKSPNPANVSNSIFAKNKSGNESGPTPTPTDDTIAPAASS